MIELKQISKSEFKIELLRNKESVPWFIWYVHNRIDRIHFKFLFKNKIHFGSCFCIINTHSIEIGILINQEFQNKGFGTALLSQLIRERKKTLVFKVSISNFPSLKLFQKFASLGELNIRKGDKNIIFTTMK